MAMWPISGDARKQLSGSHTVDAMAVISNPYYGNLTVPVLDGEVTVDSGSEVRRTGTLVTDPRLWPTTPRDVLTPFGSRCQLYRGIVLPETGDTEWVPLGLMALDKSRRSRSADSRSAATLSLVDLSQTVAEARLPSPRQTVPGETYPQGMARLVRDVLGDTWPVVNLLGEGGSSPALDIARDRWKDGISVLATDAGAEVFFDQVGQFVMRPVPRITDAPVWYARTGRGGNILTTDEEWNRDNVWNEWVISNQKSDGAAALTVVVADTNPRSVTYVDGPFGRKTRFYNAPTVLNTASATAVGNAFLARSIGLGCKIDFSLVVNPALDAGDVLDIDDEDYGRSLHIVDKTTIPMLATATQSVTTRSDIDLPPES